MPKFSRTLASSLAVTLIAGLVSRIYYTLVFLPHFHGGIDTSLMDWAAWCSYVRTPIGASLNILIIAPLILALTALGCSLANEHIDAPKTTLPDATRE